MTLWLKHHLMSATVVPLPPNSSSETTDFLRRMASMVSGRNGEMLLRAASLIESLAQRAMTAERLYHQQQDESTRNAELREAAELASNAMVSQIEALRAQLADVTAAAAAERAAFDAERNKLLGLMQHAESHIGKLTSELDSLRASVDAFNETVVSVPIEVLRLARTQFDFLSEGFARKGDVISQAMSEIGGFAIDQALTGKKTADKA
ncbi:chromosome segregation ATPase [Bradyrhizobium betae]|nr:chromosome segregation ATPase [Bradyrhizobium betae]